MALELNCLNAIHFLYGQTPLSTDGASPPAKDPPDVLSKQKCLDALAALRHAKWFQVGITYCYIYLYTLQPCLIMPLIVPFLFFKFAKRTINIGIWIYLRIDMCDLHVLYWPWRIAEQTDYRDFIHPHLYRWKLIVSKSVLNVLQ